MNSLQPLRHRLLSDIGVDHGFGLRDLPEPPGIRRPRQVHGAAVATAQQCALEPPPEADAVVSEQIGERIAVVTADCVPILLASESGSAVAVVHAGWRGIACGVIGACMSALQLRAARSERITAVIGPHIGPCCYEVDEPVVAALADRFSGALPDASRRTRPGHVLLDLGQLTRVALAAGGIEPGRIGSLLDVCTACHPERFHSHRRDGAKAGRQVHFIAAGAVSGVDTSILRA
jgi:YfiH family protein